MIYDTTFKNLVVNSIDDGTNSHSYTRLSRSLLVVYSGEMPTYEEFVTDWAALYYVQWTSSSSYPVDPTSGNFGSNVLSAYGSGYSSSSAIHVNLTGVNNEVYLDTTTQATSRKYNDGTPTFAMLITDVSAYSRLKQSGQSYPADWMEHIPFMLLSVSDTDGDGIVKLSSLDTTLSSSAPTLMSIEFEVNMGE